jgi:hypothetical protein
MSSSDSSSEAPPNDLKPLYFVAWLLCALFYLYQYAARSAPGVMQDQLTDAWGGNSRQHKQRSSTIYRVLIHGAQGVRSLSVLPLTQKRKRNPPIESER